jgi:putative FmdB family regulatory protein
MPTYDYICTGCKDTHEANTLIADRDRYAEVTPCPKCKKLKLKRFVTGVPAINFQGSMDMFKRAGDGWKEVQDRIKKGATKKHNIKTK